MMGGGSPIPPFTIHAIAPYGPSRGGIISKNNYPGHTELKWSEIP